MRVFSFSKDILLCHLNGPPDFCFTSHPCLPMAVLAIWALLPMRLLIFWPPQNNGFGRSFRSALPATGIRRMRRSQRLPEIHCLLVWRSFQTGVGWMVLGLPVWRGDQEMYALMS